LKKQTTNLRRGKVRGIIRVEVIIMSKALTLTLTPSYRAELELALNKHPLPYVRERASALLKIASGFSGREVALNGLLKERRPGTIYNWFKRFKGEGLAGLIIKPGRGRKAAFSPKFPDADSAKEAPLHVVRRDPRQLGHQQSRWTLKAIKESCNWLKLETLSGVWHVLDRLDIYYKRARSYIHSPDPNYVKKLRSVQIYLGRRFVVLFEDELTYYRQPTLAKAYELMGQSQPLALLSYRSNNSRRVVATLEASTGRVIFDQKSRIGIKQLVDFYKKVCQAYPDAKTIYIVCDNWPIHFHPDVMAALKPQKLRRPLPIPSNWPSEPSPHARKLSLPIKLVPLPTYASWTNPIEKMWRWLKQDVLHLHLYADEWDELQDLVENFLQRFLFD